jgi:hypothetical protein
MQIKRKQWNMAPQKTNNNIVEDLVESEGDESPVADIKRMVIRMFNELREELKKDIQNNSVNPKRTWIKKLEQRNNKMNLKDFDKF